MSAALERYLRDLRHIRATGAATDEASYYPPLAALLDAAGDELRPRVRCITQVREQGERVVDYLKRVLLHPAPLDRPEDLAWLLASAALGRRLAALLDPERAVEGVTAGWGYAGAHNATMPGSGTLKEREYTLGGYPVIKKWLSYREQPPLGRPLTPAEARGVRDMARRIAGILLIEPALNAGDRGVA